MGNALEVNIASEPTTAEAPIVSERPANVPEKFWNAETKAVNTEALLASYTALETKIGKPADVVVEKTPEEVAAEAAAKEAAKKPGDEVEKTAEELAAEEALKGQGLSLTELETEFETGGALSETSYEKLEKAGFSKAYVDEIIELKKGKAETIRTELMGLVGGEAEFEAKSKWASENWTEAQAKEFNEAMNSKNVGRMQVAFKALAADHAKAKGTPPKLITPDSGGLPGLGDAFQSLDQMMAAQRDPRYATDQAYRKSVEDRLRRSNLVPK